MAIYTDVTTVEQELSKRMLEIFHSPDNHTKFVIPQLPKDQWDNAAKMVMILIEDGVLQFAPLTPKRELTQEEREHFESEWCALFGRNA